MASNITSSEMSWKTRTNLIQMCRYGDEGTSFHVEDITIMRICLRHDFFSKYYPELNPRYLAGY
jgi:hypothetical protein